MHVLKTDDPTPQLGVYTAEIRQVLSMRLTTLHDLLVGCQKNFGVMEGDPAPASPPLDMRHEESRLAPPAFKHVQDGLIAAREVIDLALFEAPDEPKSASTELPRAKLRRHELVVVSCMRLDKCAAFAAELKDTDALASDPQSALAFAREAHSILESAWEAMNEFAPQPPAGVTPGSPMDAGRGVRSGT